MTPSKQIEKFHMREQENKKIILPLLLQYEAFNKEDLGRIDLPQYIWLKFSRRLQI